MKKQIRPAPLLAAAILALSLLAGCADKKGVQDDDPVVASYGETEIRRSLVDYEKQNQQALSGGKAVSDQEAVDQLLENLAMLDEAEHLGFPSRRRRLTKPSPCSSRTTRITKMCVPRWTPGASRSVLHRMGILLPSAISFRA